MSSRATWMGAVALAAAALLLGTLRCTPRDPGGTDGCVPLDGACGPAACCAFTSGADPLGCDADAGACRIQCIARSHDCTNDTGGCCAGTCVLDVYGYGTCQ